jgi:hypothetical protein
MAGPHPTSRASTDRPSARLLQRDRGGDVGQVGERLREVPEQCTGRRIELLAEQPQVVGWRGGPSRPYGLLVTGPGRLTLLSFQS